MRHPPKQRLIARVVGAALAGWQAFAPSVSQAAAVNPADVPLTVRNNVEPNMMFMIDNSGSMLNIVADSPFVSTTTYSASPTTDGATCPAGNTVSSASAVEIRIDSSQPRIRVGGTNYLFGTAAGQRCFDPTASYSAKLNADSGTSPSSYLGAQYTGNYLNWYFNMNNTTPTWNSGQTKKPGTQDRMTVTKTAAKNLLDSLSGVRVGMSTYNTASPGCSAFDTNCFQGARILNGLTSISTSLVSVKSSVDSLTPTGVTPLSESIASLGRYFIEGYSGATLTLHPGQANQATASASDVLPSGYAPSYATGVSAPTTGSPAITAWCQRNFIVLMTDGRPQADQALNGNTYLRDYDGDCSACAVNTYDQKAGRTYESHGSDYLDDVTQFLNEVDLRPDLNKSDGSAEKNNVVTYAIGFADTTVQNDPLLQEAATQGGGLFVSAQDAAGLQQAFRTISDDIFSRDGAAAAVAVANPNVTPGDNVSYASRYNSGTWTGDLEAFEIDTSTGVPSTTLKASWTSAGGSAQAQLNAAYPANSNNSGTRKIATHNGSTGTSGAGIAFQWASLSTGSGGQQSKLHTPYAYSYVNLSGTTVSVAASSDGSSVLSYLRGNRTGDGTQFRSRVNMLGDIVNAEPVVVRPPFFNYTDTGYSTFKTNQASRTKVIYQGSNDGIVHAFNADTGSELWGYVPGLLFDTIDPSYSGTSILNKLTRKSSAADGFQHKYLIDGTPASGDADFRNTVGASGASRDWRSIIVSGLGKGGRGYFALDVTTPSAADEAAVASKVLWEFPKSVSNSTARATATQRMGWSFGQPTIIKTQASGWVVLATSGYDNGSETGGDGHGYLFVINAKTGDLIETLSTDSVSGGDGCSASDPCGLTHVSAYVENGDQDNTVTQAYAGDLKGQVWRFDLTGNNSNQWSVKKLATLVDGAGSYQPITSAPELASVPVTGGSKRFVYVGTGRYLNETDVPGVTGANSHATQTQTIYGLIDDLSTNPTITGLRGTNGTTCPANGGDGTLGCQEVASSTVVDGVTTQRTFTAKTFTYTGTGSKKGWYFDLPITGERIFTNPVLTFGVLSFTSNIPNNTACDPGGTSYINFLNYLTGGYISTGGLNYSSKYLGKALASRPVLIKLPSGAIKALIRKSDVTTATEGVPTPPSAAGGRRVSWRELISQ